MDFLKELEEIGAILKGHFLLTSGLHSDTYFEKFRIIENPRILTKVLESLLQDVQDIDWVVGPALGGAIMAVEAARIIGSKAAYAEKAEKGRVLRRGYDIKKGDRLIVVDDVLTTGKSVKETLSALKGFNVLGVYVIIDRSESVTGIDIPIRSLLRIPVKNYSPEECPLCKAGIPLERRGGLKT